MIKEFIRRHDGTRYRFERDGEVFDVTGDSEKAAERLLDKTAKQKAQRAKDLRQQQRSNDEDD